MVAVCAGILANQLIEHFSTTDPDVEYCYLSSTDCEQNNVRMQLAQDNTHPMLPNLMTVVWPLHAERHLTLTLRGLEMDMGLVKVPLTFIGNQTYQADLVLPICTQSKMTWIGELSDGSLTVYPAIRTQQ
jgi:hypothetical protein